MLSTGGLSVLQKISDAYKLWHQNLPHLPRLSRYTLGEKIDTLFLETMEPIVIAGYAARNRKADIILHASGKLDLLKFFLQLAWELGVLEKKKYLAVAALLTEVGKMLGGWRRQLATEPPAAVGGR